MYYVCILIYSYYKMVCSKSAMGWCSGNVFLSPGGGGANTISKITPSSPCTVTALPCHIPPLPDLAWPSVQLLGRQPGPGGQQQPGGRWGGRPAAEPPASSRPQFRRLSPVSSGRVTWRGVTWQLRARPSVAGTCDACEVIIRSAVSSLSSDPAPGIERLWPHVWPPPPAPALI